MTYPLNGIAPLSHLGVIRVAGEDAANFLHGQLTQDFALLGMDQARLAAFLSAKGRVQASFIGFKRSATEVLLICSSDLLAPTLKRLSMFVLRAKARLTDATADFALYGLAGEALTALTDGVLLPPWSKAMRELATIVHLYPAAGHPRALWVAPSTAPAPAGNLLAPGLWEWSEVQSGVATLTAPLVDLFVPQMLNYESLGGVSFKKGCYPGQEIVARSQFRGTLKRRTYLVHAPAPITVGSEVFATSDTEQPCGVVVQTAEAPDGGMDALVSLQIASAGESLRVGGIEGVPFVLNTLPYSLLEDI
ncbi:CAF17-like 4Fe-4S cluster assembly/insertion protein YgfZ [Acidovorax sp. NCPPB 3576]|uniref:CAF17-like 4Fe-4S cluster assembly/insertion protein YgfZ n=1 Tax=Acidovorax sp. NCPPB 3576 TaxID=2940488 RepID=UPI00234B4127|nr:folate-binding protein [Acidovorax sp. NCPPB 3576]WCM90083.1 folate-binding protein [Acidovorax sp. NCPPB 3576]